MRTKTQTMRKRTLTVEVVYDPSLIAGFSEGLSRELKETAHGYGAELFHEVTVRDDPSFQTVEVEVPDPVDRDKLIEVVKWAAGEDAKQKLGLPSEWEQGYWLSYRGEGTGIGANGFCGTACCIAGKVALDDGWRPPPELSAWRGNVGATVIKNDEVRSVGPLAREILGLTENQADRLFSGDNTYEDVIRIAREILGVEDEDE